MKLKPHERIGYEYTRHRELEYSKERKPCGKHLWRVRYSRWVPVIDTTVPFALDNYDRCVVAIFNEILIVNRDHHVIIRFPPNLDDADFVFASKQLEERLKAGDIEPKHYVWGIAKLVESVRHS